MDNHVIQTITAPRPWVNLTYQEAFDTMLAHVRQQGRPAVGEQNICRYRQGELKCAVGALIPDDRYQPGFDTAEWSLPDITRHLGGSTEFYQFLEFCQQHIHGIPARNAYLDDSDCFLSDVEEGAKIAARRFNLIYKEPA